MKTEPNHYDYNQDDEPTQKPTDRITKLNLTRPHTQSHLQITNPPQNLTQNNLHLYIKHVHKTWDIVSYETNEQ